MRCSRSWRFQFRNLTRSSSAFQLLKMEPVEDDILEGETISGTNVVFASRSLINYELPEKLPWRERMPEQFKDVPSPDAMLDDILKYQANKIDSLSTSNVNSNATQPRQISQWLMGWGCGKFKTLDWCSQFGYIPYEKTLQLAFGAKNIKWEQLNPSSGEIYSSARILGQLLPGGRRILTPPICCTSVNVGFLFICFN